MTRPRFVNGVPMQTSSRVMVQHDFGMVKIYIGHVVPEDSGTYTCRAVNLVGSATTEFVLQVIGTPNSGGTKRIGYSQQEGVPVPG